MILTFGPIPGPEEPAPPPPLSPEPTPVLESPAGPFPPAPPPSGSPPETPPGEPGLPPCGEMENAPWRLPGGRVTESVGGEGSTLRLSSPAFAAEVFRVSSSARVLASAFSVAWVAAAGCGVGWGAGSGGAGAAGAAGRGTGIEGFGKGLRGGTRASTGARRRHSGARRHDNMRLNRLGRGGSGTGWGRRQVADQDVGQANLFRDLQRRWRRSLNDRLAVVIGMRRIRNDGESGVESLAATRRGALRAASRPGFPPDPGGFKVGKRSLKLRGWSMYTKCSVWCTSGASGLTNSLAMGRRTSKKMTEKCRREDNKMPGTERWYFGQGCEPWRPKRLEWGIRLPNRRQPFAERAVSWALAGQDLWSLLLHRPPNLSYDNGGIPPVGFSKRAPTNEETGIRTLPKPGYYPAAHPRSELVCNRPGQAETPPCRLF